MAFRINKSYVTAVLVLAGIGAWMGTGEIRVGGQANASAQAQSIAERNEEAAAVVPVRVVKIMANERQRQLEVRGRTEADAKISIRAETGGIVEKRFVELGDEVTLGQMICQLDPGAREARVLQAQATVIQAQADYDANAQLEERGFAAKNRVKALKAALDAANAQLREAEIELDRTNVRANAAGIVQEPIAEKGDLLSAGGVCATLIDTDPMIVTGQVSERDIGGLSVGMTATVDVITGEQRTGEISYIAPAADADTRTFRVDIDIANADGSLRDGVTATARIPLAAVTAHQILPSMLTLNDSGDIGVRLVDTQSNVNTFHKIAILGEGVGGMWVAGLPDEANIVAVGQEYIVDGQQVEPVFVEAAQ